MYDTALQEIRFLKLERGEDRRKSRVQKQSAIKQKQARGESKRKAKSKGMKATSSSPTKAWM